MYLPTGCKENKVGWRDGSVGKSICCVSMISALTQKVRLALVYLPSVVEIQTGWSLELVDHKSSSKFGGQTLSQRNKVKNDRAGYQIPTLASASTHTDICTHMHTCTYTICNTHIWIYFLKGHSIHHFYDFSKFNHIQPSKLQKQLL